MIVGGALMALPAMAQTFGTKQVEQPNAAFQSTSTMMGSGSQYSANPTLTTDGTAAYEAPNYSPAKAPGGPNRDISNPTKPQPLGDAVLPLLLMSLAFCGVLYMRKRKAQA